MKLAIVSHNIMRGDGQGRVLYELTRHVLGRGCQVLLAADRVDESILQAGAQWRPVHPILTRPLLAKVWDFAHRADRIADELRQSGYLVIGNGFTLRVPHDVSIAHMVHGAWMRVPPEQPSAVGPVRLWYQRFYTRRNAAWEKQAFAAAKRVIAVSNQVRDQLVEIGVAGDRIDVVLNGVDIDEFRAGAEDRRALSLPPDVPLAIFVGDLRSPRKNLQIVLESMLGVPALHLAVVGDVEASPYPALSKRLGLADRVHFLGRRHDVGRLMRTCDFCVFPSHSDAFGLVILEAMASGLPVLASSASGASQLVTDACGKIIAPDDKAAWTREMARLVASPADLRTMGAAAREIAEHHSFGRMADEYLDVFSRVESRT